MPFALITIGLILIIAAVKDRHAELATQLKKDFTGKNNFFYWIAGIGAVGSIGYIPAMREVSRMFLALILIVMIIADQGFFAKFTSALENIPVPPSGSKDSQGSSDILESWKPGEDGGISGDMRQLGELGGAIDRNTTVLPRAGALPGTGAIHDFLKKWGLTFD